MIPHRHAFPISLAAGMRDPIVTRAQVDQLAEMFRAGGGDVTIFLHKGGHELGGDDVDAVRAWLAKSSSRD